MKKIFFGYNRVKILNEVTRSVNAYLNDPSPKKAREMDAAMSNLRILVDTAINSRYKAQSAEEESTEFDMPHTPEDSVLDRDLRTCDLPIRVSSHLGWADIRTIRDVIKYKKSDIMKFRNIGKGSVEALSNFIEKQGVEWE
jgi:DNA-directed RNA polymerase alpha subunit